MDASKSSYRILVVDDDKDTRDVMARLLLRDGYAVATASDLASSIEGAKRKRFDLLIADLRLPDGTGLELLAHLRELYPISGIVLSGFGMAADVEQSKAAGFEQHLTKPINAAALFGAIEAVMSAHAAA